MLTHTSSILIFLDISLSIDIFFKDGVSKFLAQVHMRPKAHPVCLKAQRFVVILSAHNKRRVFTDSKNVLGYFYLYDQNDGDFKSKWAHRSLSCSKRASTQTLQ